MEVEDKAVKKILSSIKLLTYANPPAFNNREQEILRVNKIPEWLIEHPLVAGAIKMILDVGETNVNTFYFRLIDNYVISSRKRFPALNFDRTTIVKKFAKEVTLLRMINLAKTNKDFRKKFDQACAVIAEKEELLEKPM